MSVSKWKISLFFLIFFAFVYCAVWSNNVTSRYEPFCKALGKDVGIGRTTAEKDGYMYSVHKPPFLSFTGNLSISENIVVKENRPAETYVNLCIWLRGMSRYEIEVMLIEFEDGSSNGTATQFLVDRHGNLLDDTSENRQLYETNREKIENIYRLSNEMWGIPELE